MDAVNRQDSRRRLVDYFYDVWLRSETDVLIRDNDASLFDVRRMESAYRIDDVYLRATKKVRFDIYSITLKSD